MDLAELFGQGLPPVTGGALDQTHVFLEARRLIQRDTARWKAELGIL